MEKTFQLSSSGLSRNVLPSDFTFYVGGHEYQTTKSNASFISEIISDNLKVDPTFDHFFVDIEDPHYEFNTIIRLSLGQPIKIGTYTVSYLLKVFQLLKNYEITNFFLNLKNEKLNKENVLSSFATRIHYKQSVTNEINYIAANFSYFMNELKDSFYSDYLESIVSSTSLVLESEDLLFDFIMSLGEDYYYLMNYVNFQYLSESGLDNFFNNFPYNKMTQMIWNSLHRLSTACKNSPPCNSRQSASIPESLQISYNQKPFEGIFSYLWEKYSGNPHYKGVVTISSSSAPPSLNNICEIINPDFNGYWFSNNLKDSWIMFDFHNFAVKLSDYTIKSDGNGANHMTQWVIEGSNNAEKWGVIDRRKTTELCENYVVKTFKCQVENAGPFRYLRLKQTGPNSNFLNYLMISQIEFFGLLEFSKRNSI